MSVEIYEDTINFTLRHAKRYLLECLSLENGFNIYSHIPVNTKEIDILLKNEKDTFIVELKAVKADKDSVEQVLEYKKLYHDAHGVDATCYVLAPSYVRGLESYAGKLGVFLAQFDREKIVNEYFNVARGFDIDYFVLNTINIPNPQVNHFTYSNEVLYCLHRMKAFNRTVSLNELGSFLSGRHRNLESSTLRSRLRLAAEFGLCYIYGDKVSLSNKGKKLVDIGLYDLRASNAFIERESGSIFLKNFTSSQQAYLQIELTRDTYFSWYKTGIAECLETIKCLMGSKTQSVAFSEYLNWYQRRIGKTWARQDAILWYSHACEDLGLLSISLGKGKRPLEVALTQKGFELVEILRGNKESKRRITDFLMRNYANDAFLMSIQ